MEQSSFLKGKVNVLTIATEGFRMLFGRKKKSLFNYQEEKNLFAFEVDGNKFIVIPQTLRSEREIAGQASSTGAGGSLRSKSERGGMLEILVFPSGSARPMPYEQWKQLAWEVAKTQSGGAILPENVATVRFAITGTLRPPSELIQKRIREGFQLYRRGTGPPDSIEVAFIPALVNTVVGANDELLPYYPISDADVFLELQSMAIHGEIRIEGNKVVFQETQFREPYLTFKQSDT